jgi:hypothetical protein
MASTDICLRWASSIARTMLGETPEQEKQTRTSPSDPRLSTWRAKASSNPASLAHAVKLPTLSASAMAFRPLLPAEAVCFARSVAMWEAVLALPPLPQINTVALFAQASPRTSTKRCTWSESIWPRTPLISSI